MLYGRSMRGGDFFVYALIERDFGMSRLNEETTLAAFLRGKDQQAWDQLMELVEENTKNALMNRSKGSE